MSIERDHFSWHWKESGEAQEPHAVETAWRRYQHVNDLLYTTEPDSDDPTSTEFQRTFESLIGSDETKHAITEHTFITVSANSLPWTVTGIQLRPGQTVSTFASGRVWRSKNLDLWLRPQFALWFKVGTDGYVFNSTGHSNTFEAKHMGELYVANQFPGQFGEPHGGRLASPLSVYEKAEGKFEVLIILWNDGADVREQLRKFDQSSPSSCPLLVTQELERMLHGATPNVPDAWKLLWFLGTSTIYTIGEHDGQPCMHCKPYQNVGILQKTIAPSIAFSGTTQVSWDWNIASLPSRLREDLAITHDYLSVAFEFENGRDLTYTWSWELPKDYGYWCPLPSWADREYHIVIRSGTDELGQWISEQRNLHADYVKYIEGGEESAERMPKQVVRAWLIAGNRWQRFDGEMTVKKLRINHGDGIVRLL